MESISYLDFDLQVQREEEGRYRAKVLASPKGEASGDFTLPFSDIELENFLLKAGRSRRVTRRIDSPDMEEAKKIGGGLFQSLFGDEIRACFRSSQDEATRSGAGLRIRLRLQDTPELLDLPWEYLYNRGSDQFLSMSTKTPLVRYLEVADRVRPLTIQAPLRVLVMVSNPGGDYPPLDVEREWTKLQTAIGSLEQEGSLTLERLEEATLDGLRRRLRQRSYHIFHFIGHGGFDRQAQDGVLVMESEHGGRPVSGQMLGTILHDHDSLRLAVLNACEGARTCAQDPFAGTAQSLVRQGIPAVVAMQFEISDEAAIAFAHDFYEALKDGYPVDAALAESRKGLYPRGTLEWGTPVLYSRCSDGRIFAVERGEKSGDNAGVNDISLPTKPDPTPLEIISYLADEFFREHGIDLRSDRLAFERLKDAAEKAKIELSSSAQTEVHLPFIIANQYGPKHLKIRLTRAKLDAFRPPSAPPPPVATQHSDPGPDNAEPELEGSVLIECAAERIERILVRVCGQRESWMAGSDDKNYVVLSMDASSPARLVHAEASFRDNVSGSKWGALKTLGWTKGSQAGRGFAGAALGAAIYATSGLATAVLLSRKVRDALLENEASRDWPVTNSGRDFPIIAREVQLALQKIAPDAKAIFLKKQVEP